MINIGLIGYGYWGPNLARNFNANPECKLLMITDTRPERRKFASSYYPAVKVVSNDIEIIKAKDIDVVAIATPVSTHFEFAKRALESGKHLWIEKPMTATSKEAERLIDIADAKGLTIMVDHTFLFTGAVQRIKDMIESGEIGKLFYYDSVRVNLGLFQHDINVIWDLAPHDFSAMDYLLGSNIKAISVIARDNFNRGLEDMAYIIIYYDNNLLAHFHVNWLSPVKIRKTIIGGDKKMLVWDDLNPEEPIKLYDKGVHILPSQGKYRLLAEYRIGTMHAPAILKTEALNVEVDYFVKCLKSGRAPHNDGRAGLRIIKMLEACDKSLKSKGAPVEIKW